VLELNTRCRSVRPFASIRRRLVWLVAVLVGRRGFCFVACGHREQLFDNHIRAVVARDNETAVFEANECFEGQLLARQHRFSICIGGDTPGDLHTGAYAIDSMSRCDIILSLARRCSVPFWYSFRRVGLPMRASPRSSTRRPPIHRRRWSPPLNLLSRQRSLQRPQRHYQQPRNVPRRYRSRSEWVSSCSHSPHKLIYRLRPSS
jgi:hypothetical protein